VNAARDRLLYQDSQANFDLIRPGHAEGIAISADLSTANSRAADSARPATL